MKTLVTFLLATVSISAYAKVDHITCLESNREKDLRLEVDLRYDRDEFPSPHSVNLYRKFRNISGGRAALKIQNYPTLFPPQQVYDFKFGTLSSYFRALKININRSEAHLTVADLEEGRRTSTIYFRRCVFTDSEAKQITITGNLAYFLFHFDRHHQLKHTECTARDEASSSREDQYSCALDISEHETSQHFVRRKLKHTTRIWGAAADELYKHASRSRAFSLFLFRAGINCTMDKFPTYEKIPGCDLTTTDPVEVEEN